MNRKLITTRDGSHSFIDTNINEVYHSKNGALSESKHVFIKNGLLVNFKKKLTILEIGFGTGLNTLLTLKKSNINRNINYHTIEINPLKKEEYVNLNYCQIMNIHNNDLLRIHDCQWDIQNKLSKYFVLTKHLISIEKYHTNIKFDIIYFDAFAPNKQKEIWNINILGKMYNILNKDGFLVTYCAQGQVKRDLKDVGFDVMILKGPVGKREMIRATRI